MATITAANSAYAIAVAGLFPSPITLQGFAADDAFASDSVTMAENVVGVDGRKSSGFVFELVKQTITIMPDSPSLPLFVAWANGQFQNQELYTAQATIVYPSLSTKYTLKNGTLTVARLLPDAKRILQPVPFQIVWQSIIGEPL